MASLPDYIVLSNVGFVLDGNNRFEEFRIDQVQDAITNSNSRFRAILAFTVDPDGANPHELRINVHPEFEGGSLARTCRFTEGQYAGVHVLLDQARLWNPNVPASDRKIQFFRQQGGTLRIDDVVLWFQRNFPSIPG